MQNCARIAHPGRKGLTSTLGFIHIYHMTQDLREALPGLGITYEQTIFNTIYG